jgi:multimeric flavodoxin WrbA
MKIVNVLGSPRPKGNSALIADRFCRAAEALGAEVQTFSLNKLKYRGCQACMTCKTKLDRCVLKDDLTQVLDAIRDAQVLVMASPIYYGEVSSQLKAFIDRTFSYLVPDFATNPHPSRLTPGKRLVMILAQGDPGEQQYDDVFPRYESFFRWYGFDDNHLLRACGVLGPGEVEGRQDVINGAEDLARRIVAG